MKKILITLLVLGTVTLSCTPESLNDEQGQSEQFATGHGDSISTGTSEDPEPDNGEE